MIITGCALVRARPFALRTCLQANRQRAGTPLAGRTEAGRAMTPEERNKYIADCGDGFKKLLLAKADRIPPAWDCAEIQQWIMDTALDAGTIKMAPTRTHRYRTTKQVRGL